MHPILYQGPELTLYSYPLLMGLGWGVAYQVFFGHLDQNLPRWKGHLVFWGIFLSAWIGAKILFTLTSSGKSHLLSDASFWTGGGFVFYGGLLAGLAFLVLLLQFDRSMSISKLWAVIPALSFGHGIGRVGCFLAGCCYGKETNLPWAVHLHGADRHPTQLLEAIALIGLGWYLLRSQRPRKHLFILYLIVYGSIRFVLESLRGDLVRGLWGPLTPAQWISLALVLTGASLSFKLLKRRTHCPID